MIILPILQEVKLTIKQINTSKVPGINIIPVELLYFGGDFIAS